MAWTSGFCSMMDRARDAMHLMSQIMRQIMSFQQLLGTAGAGRLHNFTKYEKSTPLKVFFIFVVKELTLFVYEFPKPLLGVKRYTRATIRYVSQYFHHCNKTRPCSQQMMLNGNCAFRHVPHSLDGASLQLQPKNECILLVESLQSAVSSCINTSIFISMYHFVKKYCNSLMSRFTPNNYDHPPQHNNSSVSLCTTTIITFHGNHCQPSHLELHHLSYGHNTYYHCNLLSHDIIFITSFPAQQFTSLCH